MSKIWILKQYEYTMPFTGIGESTDNKTAFTRIIMDFELGRLLIQSDRPVKMMCNKHCETLPATAEPEKVWIRGSLLPCLPIDLHASVSDGLALTLDGEIEEQGEASGCMGLLILEKDGGLHWTVSLYIYGLEFPNREIKLSIPLFVAA